MFLVHKQSIPPFTRQPEPPKQPRRRTPQGFRDAAPLRFAARTTAFFVTWYATAPAFAAVVAGRHSEVRTGHSRCLTTSEMTHITGAQIIPSGPPAHKTSTDLDGGQTYPWEGNAGGANTGNGNKLTELPLVSWKARGGRLGVAFSLIHNSEGNHNSELGPKWTHSYDIYLDTATSGQVSVHWGDDTSYPFVQNLGGTYSAPAGIHDTLTVSGTGTSAVYTLTRKDQTVYTFGFVGNTSTAAGGWYCTSIADRSGNTITLAHNTSGYVTSITDPTSRAITLSYTGTKITGVTDPLGRTWSIAYDSGTGDLLSVSYPLLTGQTVASKVQYGYDAAHDITSITDKRGKVWTFDYFSDSSIKWQKDPLLHQTTFAYASGYTTITDPNGHVLRHNYTSGRLSSVVDQTSNTESYGYDSDNNRTSLSDRRGKSWSWTYDSAGNTLTATDPLSHTTTFTYNSHNDVATKTTQLGNVTTYTYNTAGNLTGISDPLSHATTLTVNSMGQATQIADALSHSTTLAYDGDGNLYTSMDALSHTTTTVSDGLGRPTSVTDATGRATSTAYDTWGRVSSVTTPGSRIVSFTYDLEDDKTGQTNPAGKSQSWAYDDAGRVTSHTDEISRTVSYGYDDAGNKTSFTDGRGKVTYYSFTNRNELSGVSYPDSTSESYTYRATGELWTRTDGRSITTTVGIDDAGRTTGKTYSNSTPSVSFAYDNDNRKTGMTDGTGTTSYSYDNASRLISRGSVSFGYDNANRLTSRTLSGVGVTSFGYDNANRLTSVVAPGSQTTSYTFDDAGRQLSATLPNGTVEGKSYTSGTADLLQVAVTKNSGATVVSSFAYTYDNNGRKLTETDAASNVVTHGYDDAGQLTSDVRTGTGAYSIGYTYDNAGNRATKVVSGGSTQTYAYDNANKLQTVSVGGTTVKSYTYDNAGNTTSVTSTGTSTLTWDAESRIVSASLPGSVSNTYTYNGMGQRVGKSDTVGTFTFTRGSDAVAASVLSDSVAAYVQSANGLVSEVRGSTSKFYHTDGLGSTRTLTDGSANTTDVRTTDAFGLIVSTASSGTTATPFGFAGQHGYQQDSDTGLQLLGHRYYDPSTGRFLSRDPVQDGDNWYTYCNNDPVNAIDPEGLSIGGLPPYGQNPSWWDKIKLRWEIFLDDIRHRISEPDPDPHTGGEGDVRRRERDEEIPKDHERPPLPIPPPSEIRPIIEPIDLHDFLIGIGEKLKERSVIGPGGPLPPLLPLPIP